MYFIVLTSDILFTNRFFTKSICRVYTFDKLKQIYYLCIERAAKSVLVRFSVSNTAFVFDDFGGGGEWITFRERDENIPVVLRKLL